MVYLINKVFSIDLPYKNDTLVGTKSFRDCRNYYGYQRTSERYTSYETTLGVPDIKTGHVHYGQVMDLDTDLEESHFLNHRKLLERSTMSTSSLRASSYPLSSINLLDS